MTTVATNWWAFVLRGVFAILFGLLTFIMPGMALLTLVLLWGIYALADGVFNLVAAFQRTGARRQAWWALLIEGILSIIAGVLTFAWPGLTALVLLYFIAAWALLTGAMEIAAAVRLRTQISGEWVLAVAGIFSIIFGVLLFLFPGAGALTLVLWIGAYAIVFGILLITLGLRLRKWTRSVEDSSGPSFPTVAPGH